MLLWSDWLQGAKMGWVVAPLPQSGTFCKQFVISVSLLVPICVQSAYGVELRAGSQGGLELVDVAWCDFCEYLDELKASHRLPLQVNGETGNGKREMGMRSFHSWV
jgi:hypothetical protein